MRFLIVSLLLSIAGVTFSANNDGGNPIVNRYKRMSILAKADAAKETTEEPFSDSDEEGTAEHSSDSDGEGTAEPSSDSDGEGMAEPLSDSDGEGKAEPSSDSDEEGTPELSSDSDEEGTPEPASDIDGEGTAELSSDSDGESSSDSDKEDAGPFSGLFQGCPCDCPRNSRKVFPPICTRIWIDNPDLGLISRMDNVCYYSCLKCVYARWGYNVSRVKPASTKKCPAETDIVKKLAGCFRENKCGWMDGEMDGVSMKPAKGGKCFKVPNNCFRDCVRKIFKGAYVNC